MEAAAATLDRRDELAARARAGNGETFGILYRPDFDGLFDLVLRSVREREPAVSVLQSALARAFDAFQREGAPYEVSAWLYGFARAAILGTPATRRSAPASREGLDYTRVDSTRLSDPTAGFDKELIELVWDAAVGLDRDDYSLLDLHIRRDLSVDDITEQVARPRDEVAGRLSRLCNSLNDTVCTTLLATRARHSCAGLGADLSAATSNVRRAVRRHVSECMDCRETSQRFVPATEVLASLALIQPPPGLRRELQTAFLQGTRRRRFCGRHVPAR
jgi:DNA-directed RNA polymerase specialized sigma24 family protein